MGSRVEWTRTVQRQVNKAKAAVEERRGPAGHSQSDAPILDALRHFHEEAPVSLAIPAHKSGVGASPDVLETLGEKAFEGRPDAAQRDRQPPPVLVVALRSSMPYH